MRILTRIGLIGAAACLSFTAFAQDKKEDPQTYIYTTYFNCDVTQQDEADEIFAKTEKPVLEAAYKDGSISAWGYLAHHTGGKWRRAQYFAAGSVVELLAAQDAMAEMQDDDDSDDFGEICNSHDDYIWRGVTGNGGDIVGKPRGKVGLSAYYVCDTREPAADEIVKEIFAPVYDEHIGQGKLTSWGWAEHIVGGKYRRLATMTAEDWPSLFAARESILEAGQDSALGDMFGEICSSHTDYMWEIQHETP